MWERPKPNATLDPYDNPLVTPLAEWIEGFAAREFAHEATTLQVLGITNYSSWPAAGALRECFFRDGAVRAALGELAKDRLRSMHHVGLQERLNSSVASLAAGLGYDLQAKAYKAVPRSAFAYDAPDFDVHQLVQFNSTISDPGGEVQEISVLEARRLAAKLQADARNVTEVLKKLEPQLQELVGKEDAWLAEQEGLEEASLWGRVKAAGSWVRRRLFGGAEEDGSLEDSESEKEEGDTADPAPPPPEEDYEEEDEEEDDYDARNDTIDSPWADEIVALDNKVFALQKQEEALKRDYEALMAIPEVKGPAVPAGPAKLIVEDTGFEEKVSLGTSYAQCSKVRGEVTIWVGWAEGATLGHRRRSSACEGGAWPPTQN